MLTLHQSYNNVFTGRTLTAVYYSIVILCILVLDGFVLFIFLFNLGLVLCSLGFYWCLCVSSQGCGCDAHNGNTIMLTGRSFNDFGLFRWFS